MNYYNTNIHEGFSPLITKLKDFLIKRYRIRIKPYFSNDEEDMIYEKARHLIKYDKYKIIFAFWKYSGNVKTIKIQYKKETIFHLEDHYCYMGEEHLNYFFVDELYNKNYEELFFIIDELEEKFSYQEKLKQNKKDNEKFLKEANCEIFSLPNFN